VLASNTLVSVHENCAARHLMGTALGKSEDSALERLEPILHGTREHAGARASRGRKVRV
jgi:hypothetical protein